MSITRINEFTAFPGKLDDLIDAFQVIIPSIKFAKGCESCELLIPANGKEKVVIIEQWASIAAHKDAAKLIAGSDFKRIMTLLDGAPSGKYFTPTAG